MPYERSNYQDKWRLERQAQSIRGELKLDQLMVLDPVDLVQYVGADLFTLGDLTAGDQRALRRARRIKFDGTACRHPETGRSLIILNCGKPPRRRTATLMEELAHLLLEHTPSRLEFDPALGFRRTEYNQSQEHEAYDLGSALLLPKERIQRDVKEQKLHAAEIADAHNCSQQLVSYRIRRMRLWNRYAAYATTAP